MKIVLGSKRIKFNFRDICFFLLICSVFDTLTISIPFLIICTVVMGKDFLHPEKRFNGASTWYISVIVLFLLGILWTKSPDTYRQYINFDLIRMAECLCIILWIPYYSKGIKDIYKYIRMFILVMLVLFIKLIIYTPISEWGTERLGETINLMPTMLGVSMAFGAVASFYLWSEFHSKISLIGVMLFSVISMLTGSRMGVLVLFFGISFYYVASTKGVKFLRNCIIIVIIAIVGYYLIMHVDALYNTVGVRFDNFFSKNNSEQSVQERTILRTSAIALFLQNPIWGAGTEGFRIYSAVINLYRKTYSHCNYTEMLANYGIIGFFIYYTYLFRLFVKLIKEYKNSKLGCVLLVFLCMILLSDYGYVSYYGLFQQYFIAIICAYFKLKQYNGEVKEYVRLY